MARTIAEYDPVQPTMPWTISRMRMDLVGRVKELAKLRKVTVNQLVNEMIEGALAVREGAAKRQERVKRAREEIRETIEGLNRERKGKEGA